MTVRPSDIGRPRDDSLTGMARRGGVWAVATIGAWLVPMLGVQIGAVLEGRWISLFGPRPLVRAAVQIPGQVGHGPWWQAMPDPTATPHDPLLLLVGTAIAGLLLSATATAAWKRIATATGLDISDARQQRLMDGASWATAHDLDGLIVDRDQLGNRVVLGTPTGPRPRSAAGRRPVVAVEAMHSVILVAPTGQGKTESLIAPAVTDWDGPVLVASIKRDVYDQTAGYRARHGETRVLDPTGLTDPRTVRNAYWTPLAASRDWSAARAIADQMAGVGREGAQASGNEAFFSKAAGELLGGLFYTAAHHSEPTMATVMDWLAAPAEAMPAIQTQLEEMRTNTSLPRPVRRNARHAYNAIRTRMLGHDPRTPEAIRATASNAIRAWADDRLADIATTDPGVLGPEWLWSPPSRWERPGTNRTLYVIGPDAEQATYESLFVGAVSQIYNAYARAGEEGRRPTKRLLIVLDEFPTIAPISTLDRWVTSARSLGINIILACQNLGQLDDVWGREKAATIASGPRVRMFGPGIADDQTLTYVEKLGGQTAILHESTSRNPFGLQLATSRTTSTTWRPLVSRDLLREQAPFTAIVFSGDRRPFTVAWRSRANDPELAARSNATAIPPSDDELRHLNTPRADRPLHPPTTDTNSTEEAT